MEEKQNSYKLGSDELSKELESKYFKFTKDVEQNIIIDKEDNQNIEKKIIEFEKDGQIKLIAKYDINIIVNDITKIWSVSYKVINTIQTHINKTNKFKVILRDKSYEVIPLGLKE